VVKVGGRILDDRDSLMKLSRAIAQETTPVVVVHGGGSEVTRLQAALGLEARFEAGRRLTNAADLQAAEMALSGSANKRIVRALQTAGRPACGLSGCDAGLIRCQPIPGLGRVGRPMTIDPRVLWLVLEAGLLPVVSPISLGPDGEPLNVNADEVAATLAVALRGPRLLLLSDVEGVLVDRAWRRDLTAGEIEPLIAAGQATEGMIPKLRAAVQAVEAGVGEVRIGTLDGGRLADLSGTRVLPGANGATA
jgi:acetylglutamate kinase